jgi:hypothetical protein
MAGQENRPRLHPLPQARDEKRSPPRPNRSKAFWEAYNAALESKPVEIGAELRSTRGSVSAAIAAYLVSHAWDGLSQGTKRMRRAILERFRERYGEYPLGRINENFLTAYLEALKPHAARNHLKALRGLLKHAHARYRSAEGQERETRKLVTGTDCAISLASLNKGGRPLGRTCGRIG